MALFKNERRDDGAKEPDGGEKNYEFYGSLMKKYVQSGSSDPIIGQMLEEIRVHLSISPEDHLQLMNTLKKREEARQDRAGKDSWAKAHIDLKGEIGKMFNEYKVQNLKEFEPLEAEQEVPIALMDRNPTVIPDRYHTIISAPPPPTEGGGIPVGPPIAGGAASTGITPAPREVSGDDPSTPPQVVQSKDIAMDLRPLMEDGKFAEALELVQELLEKDPYSVSLLNEKGVILYNMDRDDEAIQTFNRGLAMDPGSPELNINCAISMAKAGKLQGSLDLLDKAISKDPYNEEAWNNKAVILSRIGRLRDALICLDESLRLNERSLTAWSNAAILLERMGEYGPAFECYGRVIEIDPRNDMAARAREQCQARIRS